MSNESFKLRRLCGTAVLSAISYVLMFMEFSVPIFIPAFIKMDFSDLPALIASFAYGPMAGIFTELIKNLLHLFNSSSGGVGELSNFLLGAAFVGISGLIYHRKHTKKGAFIGALVGTVLMSIISVFTNYLLVYPIYAHFMPMDQIIAAYMAILPFVHNLLECLIVFNVPFTFIKGLICLGITMLIYKPLHPILKGYK